MCSKSGEVLDVTDTAALRAVVDDEAFADLGRIDVVVFSKAGSGMFIAASSSSSAACTDVDGWAPDTR